MADDKGEYIVRFGEEGADKLLSKIDEIEKRLNALGSGGGGAGPGGRGPSAPNGALLKTALTFAKRIIAVGVAMKTLQKALQTAQGGQQLGNIANVAGTTTKALQQFGNAIKILGGDAKSAYQAFQQMNASLTGLKFGEGGALEELMYKFGVNPLNDDGTLKNPQQLFEHMADIYRGLAKEDRAYFAQKAGWTPEMAKLAEGGSAEVRAQENLARQYALTEEAVKAQSELAKAWNEMSLAWSKTWGEFVGNVSPLLVEIIKALTPKENKEKEESPQKRAIATHQGVPTIATIQERAAEREARNKGKPVMGPFEWAWRSAKYGSFNPKDWPIDIVQTLRDREARNKTSYFLPQPYWAYSQQKVSNDNSVSTRVKTININTSRPVSEVLSDLENSGWNAYGMMLEAQGQGF